MGIQDRDYYREGPSFLDRVGQQGATVWLIAITCGVFFGQLVPGSPLTQLGLFDPKRILEGEVWRLLTPVFLHSPSNIFHIFFNMFVLFWVGRQLEALYGSREFLLFYLLAGIGSNALYLAAQFAELTPPARALGASGAVTAAFVLFACHYPHAQVRLYFIIPMPMWLCAILLVGFDMVFAMSAVPDPRGGKTAYFGHLGGAAFGLLYYQSGVQFSRLFARSPRSRVRPTLRVIVPSDEEDAPEPVGAPVEAPPRPAAAADEQLEAKLDAILEKVSKHGQESLTPEEREILVRASELYKKRRK